MGQIRLSTVAALCLTLWLASDGFSQQASITSLVGTVTDANAALMGGANVTAANDGTRETYSGVTNGQGYYSFQFVRIGTYTITASYVGFSTIVKTNVVV